MIDRELPNARRESGEIWGSGQVFSRVLDEGFFYPSWPVFPVPIARVRVVLYGTPAQLAQAQSAVTSRYPSAGRIFDRNDGSVETIGSLSSLTLDLRTKAQTDGDVLWEKGAVMVTALRAIGVTGTISYHQCTHTDAQVAPCIPSILVI